MNKNYSSDRTTALRAHIRDISSLSIENDRRQRFLEEANRQFAALRADPQAWQEEQEERAEWDTVLMDGLENDLNGSNADQEQA